MKNAKRTIFDKIWDNHVVRKIENGPDVLFIDRHLIHEVTSPQAFDGLRNRDIQVLKPERTFATADHNVPTLDQHLPVKDELSAFQLNKLTENCREYNITLYGLNHPYQGIVHVMGPELGITLPGMTIVCGDSHTSTHGAFGSIAFGIGTSEVEMVLATQCLLQVKPHRMKINVEGRLREGVCAKDIILYIISRLSASGGTGYFVEYAGSAIRELTMEERMTVCNMSIEMGAKGGLIAPDEITYEYIKGRKFAPSGDELEKLKQYWDELNSDPGAEYDLVYNFRAEDIPPMVTYGTNPGMGAGINESIPGEEEIDIKERKSFRKALDYMGLEPGSKLSDIRVDYVFVGSCTNGRIEDLRAFASYVKGFKKSPDVRAWIVPGSKQVEKQAVEEGIVDILMDAGFELRQPGCSACLAMNDDKIPEGKYAVSTSNRNFEGRQGPGARTILASPLTAAASAITGKLSDPRKNY